MRIETKDERIENLEYSLLQCVKNKDMQINDAYKGISKLRHVIRALLDVPVGDTATACEAWEQARIIVSGSFDEFLDELKGVSDGDI